MAACAPDERGSQPGALTDSRKPVIMNVFRGSRALLLSAVLLSLSLLAGCQTGGGSSPTARTTSGTVPAHAIAFESIDGPPPPVFQRLVANLSTEAQERKLAVVSRDTVDAEFAQNRQRFLAEQGYAYRIIDAEAVDRGGL